MKKVLLVVALLIALTIYYERDSIGVDMGCMFGKKGDGNVTTFDRPIGDFNGLKVSQGISTELIYSDTERLEIDIDFNLISFVSTEVDEDGILRLNYSKNICPTATHIKVYFNNLNSIKSSSGSYVISNDTIKNNYMDISVSSGSNIEAVIITDTLNADVSSGGDLELKGNAAHGIFETSSGANIYAKELLIRTGEADASSGSSIEIAATESLDLNASSGAEISYIGSNISTSESVGSGGSVRLID